MSDGHDNRPWTGRSDPADGPAALRWHQMVQKRGPQASPVALLGFASDAGVARNHGRVGAAEGPAASRARKCFRAASRAGG